MCGCASAPIHCSPLAGELQCRPQAILDDVHVIFVESPVDIWHIGKLEQVCCAMRDMGLRNAVYFNPYHDGWLQLNEYVQEIRDENPNSRIMLVGWSIGALFVEGALKRLDANGESIETVVYIDSKVIKLWELLGHPDNYDRMVLIHRRHHRAPCSFPDAVVRYVDCFFHLPCAHQPQTVDQLVKEAIRLADDRAYETTPGRPYDACQVIVCKHY